jgi:hypothetical protein
MATMSTDQERCQCEHGAHFDESRANHTDAHGFQAVYADRIVRTTYGRMYVCTACLNHMEEGGTK